MSALTEALERILKYHNFDPLERLLDPRLLGEVGDLTTSHNS